MNILEILELKMKEIDDRRGQIAALHYSFQVFLKGTKDLGISVATEASQSGNIHLTLFLSDHLHSDLEADLIDARPNGIVAHCREDPLIDFSSAVLFRRNADVDISVDDIVRAPADQDPSTISEKSDDVRGTPESVTPRGAVGDGGGTAGAEMSPPTVPSTPVKKPAEAKGSQATFMAQTAEFSVVQSARLTSTRPDDAPRQEAPAPREPALHDLVTGPFSEDEVATLIDQHLQGASVAEIAQALGRAEKSIKNKLGNSRAQIHEVRQQRQAAAKKTKAPKPKAPPAPAPAEDLEAVGMWTPKLDLKLAKLMAKGTGEGGAAAVLKLGREDVHVRWKQIKAWVGEPIQSNDDIVQLLAGRLAHHDGHTST